MCKVFLLKKKTTKIQNNAQLKMILGTELAHQNTVWHIGERASALDARAKFPILHIQFMPL